MSKSDIRIPDWIKPKLFENLLRETIQDFQQIKEFKVFPALAPGENYATVMLKVHVVAVLTTGSLHTQSFMLKVAHDSELYRKEISKWQMFIIESGMYQDIVPELENLYAEAGQNVQFGAKCYQLPVDVEYILLEDLSLRGFRNAKRQDCLNMEHCKSVLQKIAQFHAASAVRIERKGMFEKRYLHGFLTEETKTFCKSMFDTSLPHVMKTVESLENHGGYYEQLKNAAENIIDIIYEQCSVDTNEFNVLNHGDCWANNIMFRYDKQGNLKETYLVDLQLPRYGSPAQDLLYFILSSAHLDIKTKKFDCMIKYYYDNLIENLKLLKYKKPMPTLSDIHGALIKYSIWGLTTAVTVMAAVLCEATDTANIDNFVGGSEDAHKFKEILYTNARYAEHLNIVMPWLCDRGTFEC